MKLKFKHQIYQDDATKAVIDIFEGQPKLRQGSYELFQRTDFLTNINVLPNPKIILNEDEIKKNIQRVQYENNIPSSDFTDLQNFTIEMETGTGKTYTYINTMYELYNKYGMSKFIIIVPSVAIREGVHKSLEITKDHFQEKYGEKIRYYVYNSKNPQNILDFTDGSGIQCLVMNFQAFNSKTKDARKIYTERDEFGSNSPISLLQKVNPIIIIDEPQKIADKTEKIISNEFNPLFYLRYSATHKKGKEFNKIYSLNAVDAYNKKLVKKIEVVGVELVNNISEGTYIYVGDITTDKQGPMVKLEIEKNTSKSISKFTKYFKVGDDLYSYSNYMQPYKGYVISEINAHPNEMWVQFTNGETLYINQLTGQLDRKHIFRTQIRETVRAHIKKEQELFKKNIKVLTLFFVDKVANYRDYSQEDTKGFLARTFEEVYDEEVKQLTLDENYKNYILRNSADEVHNGYFSIDKKTNHYKDSNKGKSELGSDDVDAYDLILKDKERLLSFEEPTRFIFSHSALREGWDNPNIFQICTLKESGSEINKRQEIGRGLRICVNQNGERMDEDRLGVDFHFYNTLTVVASESYENFSKELQKEMLASLSDKKIIYNGTELTGKVIKNSSGEELIFTGTVVEKFNNFLDTQGYVDYGEVTEKFKKALQKDKLKLPKDFESHSDELRELLDKEVFNNKYNITNAGVINIDSSKFKLNKNFEHQKFQELWKKINLKTTYEVDFETDILIEKSIQRINTIQVPKMQARITKGTQKDNISEELLIKGKANTELNRTNEVINEQNYSKVKYDIIGEIKKNTNLMRSTIISVLKQIDEITFKQYSVNPEAFIFSVSEILNDEKASCIIDGIKYYKTENRYDNNIFIDNKFSGQLNKDVFEVNNHIYDYVKVDSKVEENFAKDMDKDNKIIYAKLPSGFKISTPVGSYNPDWAIVIDRKDIKYIYFIAETKGTNKIHDLTRKEKAKIACAKEHFASISDNNLRYDVVKDYNSLINMIS